MTDYIEEDNGTMPDNVEELGKAIIGHRIVKVEKNATIPESKVQAYYYGQTTGTRLELDNGKSVFLLDTDDCCAYTELKDVIEKLPAADHIITAVRSNEAFTEWYIIADMDTILQLDVSWSPGNPFYYSYGLAIHVVSDTEN